MPVKTRRSALLEASGSTGRGSSRIRNEQKAETNDEKGELKKMLSPSMQECVSITTAPDRTDSRCDTTNITEDQKKGQTEDEKQGELNKISSPSTQECVSMTTAPDKTDSQCDTTCVTGMTEGGTCDVIKIEVGDESEECVNRVGQDETDENSPVRIEDVGQDGGDGTDEVVPVAKHVKLQSVADSSQGREGKAKEEMIRQVRQVYKKESVLRKQMKGRPKSGRKWKTEQTARFSDMRKDKPLKSSWQRKMAQKAEKLSVRKYQQELQDARREAIELKKQRRKEHQVRKEENQKKSEVVQVIRNTAKLKRMRKKQLRQIQKR